METVHGMVQEVVTEMEEEVEVLVLPMVHQAF